MLRSLSNPFTHEGKITLVLDNSHAGFQTAQDIEDLINTQPDFVGPGSANNQLIARAIDQRSIEIQIPDNYRENPVLFASLILGQRLIDTNKEARVVIDERSGAIIVGDDVEVGPVAVSHKNLTIETRGGVLASQFVPLDPEANTAVPKLKALVDALNALQVPTRDVIDIIKGLERSGHLYGHLIIVE
jgi:flagellar P-ring protein precursor FlgI